MGSRRRCCAARRAGAVAWTTSLSRRAWRARSAALTRRLPAAFAIGVTTSDRSCRSMTHWQRRRLARASCTTTPTRACRPRGCRCALELAGGDRGRDDLPRDADSRGEVAFAPADVRVRSRWRFCELLERARRERHAGASIPTSRRSRATPGWPAIAGCRRSASRPTSSAARAPTSSSCPNTASAIRCGTSTGGRRSASASRSSASSRTSAISA